jgi:hypothetical protein
MDNVSLRALCRIAEQLELLNARNLELHETAKEIAALTLTMLKKASEEV